MAIVSISEAARLAGVGRATLYRRIDDGTISTVQNHDGSRGIDTSEILRVFGCLQATADTNAGRPAEVSRGQPETVSAAAFLSTDAGAMEEVQALKHQNQLLLANLTSARKALDEARDREARLLEREERLLSMVEQSQRLLTDKTKPQQPAAAPDGAILQLADRIDLLVRKMEAADREKNRMAEMAETYDPLMAELASDMLALDDLPATQPPRAAVADQPAAPARPAPAASAASAAPETQMAPAAQLTPAAPAVPLSAAMPMVKRDDSPLPQPPAMPAKKRPWWRLGR